MALEAMAVALRGVEPVADGARMVSSVALVEVALEVILEVGVTAVGLAEVGAAAVS